MCFQQPRYHAPLCDSVGRRVFEKFVTVDYFLNAPRGTQRAKPCPLSPARP